MRESAPTLLGGIASDFTAPPSMREGECPLEFARNLWLIYKEALHNVARHSGASRVSIRIAEPDGGFELEVRDDGHGFIESERSSRAMACSTCAGEPPTCAAPCASLRARRGTTVHLTTLVLTPADIKPFSSGSSKTMKPTAPPRSHRHGHGRGERRAGLQVVRSRVQGAEASPAFGSPGVVLLDIGLPA